ncbi:CRE-PQN-27 protein [Aphelenchoides avenae]|nr:CRE-PQN-27 protein [Aphelenchus avenae]
MSGFYGYGAQQSSGMPASNYQGQQPVQRGHHQQHQQQQGGRGGFNPDAPSFQPRQRTSPQGSGFYQQQQLHSNPAGFGFNPFGYQSPRPGFQPHLQQAQARAAYAQAVSPHAGPPHGYHARSSGPPPQYEMMTTMMGPPGGGYGDADFFGYDSFGDGASPAVASQCALSTELVERMQSSTNKCVLLEIQIGLEQMISEQDFDTWSTPIRDRLASKELQPEDVSLAASLIVEMAVLDTGCQYNFARLCQIIQQSMPT